MTIGALLQEGISWKSNIAEVHWDVFPTPLQS